MTQLPSNTERKSLFDEYNALVAARGVNIDFTVEEAAIGNKPVETMDEMNSLDTQIENLRYSSTSKTWVRIFAPSKKDDVEAIRSVTENIRRLNKEYTRRSSVRSSYGILFPLAFGSFETLPRIFDDQNMGDVLEIQWHVQFQRPGHEGHADTLIDAINQHVSKIQQWWFEGEVGDGNAETKVWSDLKRLAFKLICLFDKRVENERLSESRKFGGICLRLKELAIGLIRLVHREHAFVEDIRPLFELFVPLVYAISSVTDGNIRDDEQCDVISHLETYLHMLEVSKAELMAALDITDDLEN
ncbi:MKNK1 [Sanghuangporus weigelae]